MTGVETRVTAPAATVSVALPGTQPQLVPARATCPTGKIAVSSGYNITAVPLQSIANNLITSDGLSAEVIAWNGHPTITTTLEAVVRCVDPLTSPPTDMMPPTITTRLPADGATGVAVEADITATFSEDVTGVNGTSFELRGPANVLVPAAVTYDAAGRMATLNPTAALATGTTYIATAKGSAGGIRDTATNALVDTSWSFTTVSGPPPTSPPHDNFANAKVVASVPFTDGPFSTVDAALEPGESRSCISIGNTVWYRFTPSSSGTYVADTGGSSFGAGLAVYTGVTPASLANLTQVGCGGIQVSFAATAGTTYYLQIGGPAEVSGDLILRLTMSGPPTLTPPPHDNFANGKVIASVPFTDGPVSTANATLETGEPRPCASIGNTVWYRFTPASGGNYVVDTAGSSFTTILIIYAAGTPASLTNLTQVGCDATQVSFAAIAGTTYYLQIGGVLEYAGDVVVRLTANTMPPPSGTTLAFTQQPTGNAVASQAFSQQPKVAAQDASGNTFTNYTGVVTLSKAPSSTGTGNFACGGGLSQTVVNGVATFSGCQFDQPGTYVLRATSGTLTAVDSAAISVVPRPTATKLAFTQQPSSLAAPAQAFPQQPRVTVQDASGTTISNYTGTVFLAKAPSNTGTGNLTCTGGLSQMVTNGVATFSGCQFDQPGSYVLRATSLPLLVAADSMAISVTTQFELTADTPRVWANGHQEVRLTATLAGTAGQPPASRIVSLSSSQALNGLTISPAASQTTGPDGRATFTVKSTSVSQGEVTFTARVDGPPQLPATTKVTFERHKIVVLFPGINTKLTCRSDGVCDDNDNPTFRPLRDALTRSQRFAADDILWYSYNGGTVDTASGKWRAANYTCDDTSKTYASSINAMMKMLGDFSTRNPNTDFYLVGHSQGGLIAFQALILARSLPNSSSLAGVITLDSPLGGAPGRYAVAVTRLNVFPGVCWNIPASQEIAQLYDTTTNHAQQGTSAMTLCSLAQFQMCRGVRNSSAVFNAQSQTMILTYGSSDDAVFVPSKCRVRLYNEGDQRNSNTTSQFVDGATITLQGLGMNTPQPSRLFTNLNDIGISNLIATMQLAMCVQSSHNAVLAAFATDVANRISAQIGGP